MASAAEYFDSWLRSQEKAMEDWAETTKHLKQTLIRQRVLKHTGTGRASSEIPGRELFDLHAAWLTLMNASMHTSDWWVKGMEVWADTAKQFQPSFRNPKETNGDAADCPEARISGTVSGWITLLGPLVERKQSDIVKEAALKLFGSRHLDQKLYEACQPFFETRGEEAPDDSPRETLVDPQTYKEIMECL